MSTVAKHYNPQERVDTALAPYNFVALNEKVISLEGEAIESSLPDQDRYHEGRYSGTIHCKLTAETPVFVRAPLSLDEYATFDAEEDKKKPYDERVKNRPDFFHINPTDPDKTPRIPASSLRGMLRTLVEIVSYGKFEGVTKRPMVYRAVGDTTTHGNRYRDQIMELDEQGRDERDKLFYAYTPLVRAGYMVQVDSEWYIYPAQTIGNTTFARINQNKLRQAGRLERVAGCKNASYLYIQPGTWKHQLIRGGLIRTRFSKVLEASNRPAAHLVRGVLAKSGEMFSKKSEAVVFPLDPDGERIPVSDDLVAAYLAQVSQEQQALLGSQGVLTEGEKPVKEGGSERDEDGLPTQRQPVFYLVDDDNELSFFGHTMMMRVPYQQLPLDLVPDALRQAEQVDMAEAIFGFTKKPDNDEGGRGGSRTRKNQKKQAYAGRVFFGDAVLDAGQGNVLLSDEPITPKILASPKATAFQQYLVQPQPDPLEVGRTRDGKPKYQKQLADYAAETPDETLLRGYKLYWHKDGPVGVDDIREPTESFERMNPKDQTRRMRDSQYTLMKPVKPGTHFGFDIRFENLSAHELGALLWAATLPDTSGQQCRHKIGMGKPLGMGTVHIEPTLQLEDRITQRYGSLFSQGDSDIIWESGKVPAQEGKAAADFIQAFEAHILEGIGLGQAEGLRLSGQHRIQELLALLAWPGPPKEETVYMELKEFRQRAVLPSPVDTGPAPPPPQRPQRTQVVQSDRSTRMRPANSALAQEVMGKLGQGTPRAEEAPLVETTQSQQPVSQPASKDEVEPGMWLTGTVVRIEPSRLVVNIGVDDATLPLDQVVPRATSREDLQDLFAAGTEVRVQVRRINKKGRIQLTMKEA